MLSVTFEVPCKVGLTRAFLLRPGVSPHQLAKKHDVKELYQSI